MLYYINYMQLHAIFRFGGLVNDTVWHGGIIQLIREKKV